MELIPILSTIILVATISTFILAVGAYFLYKVQESKAEKYEKEEVKPELAEIVEPTDFGKRELVIEKRKDKPVYVKSRYQPVETIVKYEKSDMRIQDEKDPSEPKFRKHTSDGYVVAKDDQKSGVISWR